MISLVNRNNIAILLLDRGRNVRYRPALNNMASPLRSVFVRISSNNLSAASCSTLSMRSGCKNNVFAVRTAYRSVHTGRGSGSYRIGKYFGAGVCVVGGASVFSYFRLSNTSDMTSSLSAAKSSAPDQSVKLTRMVL